MVQTASIDKGVKRRELVKALCDAIFKTGEAWVVDAAPGKGNQLRLEILQGSPLADVLEKRYRLHRGGTSTRIIGNAIKRPIKDNYGNIVGENVHAGEVTVDVWYLELPSS